MTQEAPDEYQKARDDINKLLDPSVAPTPPPGVNEPKGEIKVSSSVGQQIARVLLKATQRSPANWHIVPNGDNIFAQCGGIEFNGTIAEFNAMLKSGVME